MTHIWHRIRDDEAGEMTVNVGLAEQSSQMTLKILEDTTHFGRWSMAKTQVVTLEIYFHFQRYVRFKQMSDLCHEQSLVLFSCLWKQRNHPIL